MTAVAERTNIAFVLFIIFFLLSGPKFFLIFFDSIIVEARERERGKKQKSKTHNKRRNTNEPAAGGKQK